MRGKLESGLCACTKNVLFFGPALLGQRFLQFINKVLINCNERWNAAHLFICSTTTEFNINTIVYRFGSQYFAHISQYGPERVACLNSS